MPPRFPAEMNSGITIEAMDEYRVEDEVRQSMILVCETALDKLCTCDCDVFISVTGEGKICELNQETRGINAVTDVLSFPYIDFAGGQTIEAACEKVHMQNPETGRLMLGDVVICLPRALEQAEEYGHSPVRELCFLALHGLLHLLGYDHEVEPEAEAMFAVQESILSECGIVR